MKQEDWEAALAARVRPLLERMLAGEDVPPALWHRAEGFAEAGIAVGATTPGELAGRLAALYAEVLGADTGAMFDSPVADWIEPQGTVRLRFRLPRAPVFVGGNG